MHHVHSAEVYRLLGVEPAPGLATAEVLRRQREFGPNRVTAQRGPPAGVKFLQQFNQQLVHILIAAVGVTAFLGEWVESAVVNVIVLIEEVYLFNCPSLRHSVFAIGLFQNRWVIGSFLAMLGAQLLFSYTPVMNRLSHSAPISAGSWLRIVGLAAMVFVVVETEKWLRFSRPRVPSTPNYGRYNISAH